MYIFKLFPPSKMQKVKYFNFKYISVQISVHEILMLFLDFGIFIAFLISYEKNITDLIM